MQLSYPNIISFQTSSLSHSDHVSKKFCNERTSKLSAYIDFAIDFLGYFKK